MTTTERIYTTKPNPITGEVSEIKTENIYLNRLKEQYKKFKSANNESLSYSFGVTYRIERAFCLDTQLISFNDIEVMESEINSSF